MNKSFLVALGVTLGIAGATPASAVDITFRFNGTINSINDDFSQLDSSVQIGRPFNGTYTFDSEYAASFEEPFGATVSFGNYNFDEPGGFISINIDPTIDTYSVNAYVTTDALLGQPGSLSIDLASPSQNVFTSGDPPLTPPNVALFGNRDFSFGYPSLSGSASVSGTINSIQPVPEPPETIGTLTLGIFGAGWMLKRKLKKQA